MGIALAIASCRTGVLAAGELVTLGLVCRWPGFVLWDFDTRQYITHQSGPFHSTQAQLSLTYDVF